MNTTFNFPFACIRLFSFHYIFCTDYIGRLKITHFNSIEARHCTFINIEYDQMGNAILQTYRINRNELQFYSIIKYVIGLNWIPGIGVFFVQFNYQGSVFKTNYFMIAVVSGTYQKNVCRIKYSLNWIPV